MCNIGCRFRYYGSSIAGLGSGLERPDTTYLPQNTTRYMYRYLLLIALLASTLALSAQDYVTIKEADKKLAKLFDRGRKYAQNGLYEKAIKDFEKVLEKEPRLIDAHLMRADLKYSLKELPAAEAGFEQAIEMGPGYSAKAYFLLATIEAEQEKYAEAAEHYGDYIDHPKASGKLLDKAKQRKAEAEFAAVAVANPVPFEPKSLGPAINTPSSEYLPVLTAQGDMLIYTARVRGQEDFYVSRLVDGEWTAGRPLAGINTPDNEGAQSISADGRYLVYTVCNRRPPLGYGSCDIYYAEYKGGVWTRPVNIGRPINTRDWESQPSISANGDKIYFASSRPGGKGGRDIWVTHRLGEDKWSTPQNLSDNINTPGNDQSPFIHPDGQTLYFMSSGHPGMGGNDLFMSKLQPDGTWGKPVNLGYPINTPGEEGSLFVSLDGKTAYLASDRHLEAGAAGKSSFEAGVDARKHTDLYAFELHEAARPEPVTYAQATVVDADTRQPLSAKLEIVDLSTGKLFIESYADRDGRFLVCLPAGTNYALNVSQEGYLFHSENFALEGVASFEEPYQLEVALQRIPVPVAEAGDTPAAPPANKPIVLRNVFFETASADLLPTSQTELNRLRDLLNDYPDMRIKVMGHTDNVGSDSDNLDLSNRRAEAVRAYLIAQGIAAERMAAEGYGELQPIATNDTPEGRQRNRRTEFVVE